MSLAAPPHVRTRAARRIGIVVVLTAIAVAVHIWYRNRHHFLDLFIYRDAVRWWDAGNPLYEFAHPDATQGRLGFTYPPFAAFLLRPLAWLTTTQAVWAYIVVTVLAFAASVWWLVRPMADRHGWPRWFAFAIVLVLATGLEPIREGFTFGQINFVLWVLILFDLLVLLPRGSRFTGVGIGLATAIKLVPGIFIVYLLVTRRWRAAAMAAGATVAATALAAVAAPRDSWTFLTEQLTRGEGVGQLDYAFNQSVLGTLARLAHPDQPSRLLWLVLVLAVLGYGLWRAARAAAAGDEVSALTLVGIVGSLVSPVTWVHHVFWFVPALVVLLDTATGPVGAAREGLRPRWGLIGLAALIYVTVTVSVLSLWEFTLGRPGGPVGFVLSNWFVWLMLALLPALPIRRQVAVET